MLVEKTFIVNNKAEINILDQNKSFDFITNCWSDKNLNIIKVQKFDTWKYLFHLTNT